MNRKDAMADNDGNNATWTDEAVANLVNSVTDMVARQMADLGRQSMDRALVGAALNITRAMSELAGLWREGAELATDPALANTLQFCAGQLGELAQGISDRAALWPYESQELGGE